MIVVCGLLADAPVRLVCGRLELMGYDYLFFDQATFPAQMGMTQRWRQRATEGCLEPAGGPRVDLADITGVYVRYSDYKGGTTAASFTAQEEQLIKAERMMSYSFLFDHLPCAVVNPLRSMVSNDSKPLQAMFANAFGFLTPPTILTSSPDEVRRFVEECHGDVVYKPIGSTRAVVNELTDEKLAQLDRLRHCPVQFQKRIRGVNVRVHVVGDQTFATRAHSPEIDYRYAATRFEAVELEPALHEKCVAISRFLGLHLAGIDFIESDDGYYCLEVNPSPAFNFYEFRAFQPISQALAELLRDGRAAHEQLSGGLAQPHALRSSYHPAEIRP